MKTQLRAICPICFNEHALRAGRLVQHGYRRPQGWHQNVNTCGGTNMKHFGTEAGRDAAQKNANSVAAWGADRADRAAKVESGEITELHVMQRTGYGQRQLVKITADTVRPYDWQQAVRAEVWKCRSDAKAAQEFFDDVMKRIAAWQPAEPRKAEVEEKARPVHLRIKSNFKVLCAGSYMGGQRIANSGILTDDRSKVTCERCLKWMAKEQQLKAQA